MRSLLILILLCGSAYAGTAAYNVATRRVVEIKRGGAASSFSGKSGYAVVSVGDEDVAHNLGLEYIVYDATQAKVVPLSAPEIAAKKQAKKNLEISNHEARLEELAELKAGTTDQDKHNTLCDLEFEIENKIQELQQ